MMDGNDGMGAQRDGMKYDLADSGIRGILDLGGDCNNMDLIAMRLYWFMWEWRCVQKALR